jgi:hypothetical protein
MIILEKEDRICPKCNKRVTRIPLKELTYDPAGYLDGYCPFCNFNFYTMSLRNFPEELKVGLVKEGKVHRRKRANIIERLYIPLDELMFKSMAAFIIVICVIAFSFFGLLNQLLWHLLP